VRSYAQVAASPPKGLTDAGHVLVAREKLTGRPLVPTYSGPYRVLERRPKVFKILHNGKEDWISVDRLKAYWKPAEAVTGSEVVPGDL